MRFLFATPVLVLSLLAAFAAPASADSGYVEVGAGALVVDESNGNATRPTVQADAGFSLLGPLHLGAYVNVVGRDLPLSTPGMGVGGLVALHGDLPVINLTLHLEASLGHQNLPVGETRSEAIWQNAYSVGLGIPLAPRLRLSARFTQQFFHGVADDSPLGSRAWGLRGGLTVKLP